MSTFGLCKASHNSLALGVFSGRQAHIFAQYTFVVGADMSRLLRVVGPFDFVVCFLFFSPSLSSVACVCKCAAHGERNDGRHYTVYLFENVPHYCLLTGISLTLYPLITPFIHLSLVSFSFSISLTLYFLRAHL